MLKPYNEMREVDVTQYCEERDGMKYLNWAKCIDLLHENGAEKAYFEPIPDERTGSSLRMTDAVFTDSKNNTNKCYETRIRVVIDDNEYIMQSPVMNGSNPVKDNSMSQQRVWNSMCRSFVKCVAIHTGLGFNLWLKEEMQPFSNAIPVTDGKATVAQIKVLRHYEEQYHVRIDDWVAQNGKTVDTLTESEAARMLIALAEKYGETSYDGESK